jgi:hypothetical protein
MVNIPIFGPFSPKDENLRDYRPSGAAQRRAVA